VEELYPRKDMPPAVAYACIGRMIVDKLATPARILIFEGEPDLPPSSLARPLSDREQGLLSELFGERCGGVDAFEEQTFEQYLQALAESKSADLAERADSIVHHVLLGREREPIPAEGPTTPSQWIQYMCDGFLGANAESARKGPGISEPDRLIAWYGERAQRLLQAHS
jgi:hypothetical protein